MDSEVKKTSLDQLIQKFVETGQGLAKNTQVTTNAIIKSFKKWGGRAYYDEVRKIRPSQLDEWLASEEPRLGVSVGLQESRLGKDMAKYD